MLNAEIGGDAAKHIWTDNPVQVFVQLKANTDLSRESKKISNIISDKPGPAGSQKESVVLLHPMRDWHLYSQFRNGGKCGRQDRVCLAFRIYRPVHPRAGLYQFHEPEHGTQWKKGPCNQGHQFAFFLSLLLVLLFFFFQPADRQIFLAVGFADHRTPVWPHGGGVLCGVTGGRSVVLAIGTLIIYQQIRFLQGTDRWAMTVPAWF